MLYRKFMFIKNLMLIITNNEANVKKFSKNRIYFSSLLKTLFSDTLYLHMYYYWGGKQLS